MSFKLHLISVFMQIRCDFPEILYLSETQNNNFQFLIKIVYREISRHKGIRLSYI